MSRLKRLLIPLLMLALFLAALSATPAHAQYTFSNGYYWANGTAYNRTSVAYYDSYGCKRYRWQYSAVKVITSQTEGWRTKLLELKSAREKWQASIESSANEHNEFIEAVRELGLDGTYGNSAIGLATINRSNPYAIAGGVGYSQLSAAQGSTHYGYAPMAFSVADVYGNVDIGALYNASIRLASDSNQYGSKATSNAMTLVDQLGSRAASLMDRAIAVKEIEAKSAGIAMASQAIAQSIRAEARAYVAHGQTGGQGGNGQPPPPDAAKQADILNGTLSNIADVMTYRCVTCHQPGGKAEQFDLSDLSAVTAENAADILSRVTSSDQAKRMPPDKPLSIEELRVVFAAAGANEQGQQPAKQD